MQMLKTVSISFIDSELVRKLRSVGCFQICSGNSNTSLLLYAYEVIPFDKQGCDFTVCLD